MRSVSRRWKCMMVGLVLLAGSMVHSQSEKSAAIGTHPLPALAGATGWLNSKPLTAADLKGKVVLIDFWDYSCINCIRAIPYVRAWADKYKNQGLVVIGVHTPEFDVEKQLPNVQRAAQKFGITYPIAVDSDNKIWDGFHNEYWPAEYFIDATGKVRYTHFGEGHYDESEKWIQQLLQEAGAKTMPGGAVSVHGQGAQAASDVNDVQSPETYIGFSRAQNFAAPGGIVNNTDHMYAKAGQLSLNQWALQGNWFDGPQAAVLKIAGGSIVFRFHARDLHLVLGTAGNKPVRFRVTLDGRSPGANHGVDTDANGDGVVKDHRLYQLIRLNGPVADHTFSIEFLDPGVQAFSFTFG